MTQPPLRLGEAFLGDEEVAAVTAVLRSGWLSAGPVTDRFERAFAEAVGASHAVAVSSGTAALHLAMLAIGLRPGDEVVMPSLSFVAAAEVVSAHGATPVFADVISADEPTVSPVQVAALITDRTRAVVVMHYGGFPARVEEVVRSVAGRAVVIEDAAHAPVVRAGHRCLGTVGDIGCFSFYANKNMTTGEGGMVVSDDDDIASAVRRLRSHGLIRTPKSEHDYDVTTTGLNYRPTDVASALGVHQLERLLPHRPHLRMLVDRYRDRLSGIPGVVVPFAHHHEDAAHHLMAVVLPAGTPRRAVREHLAQCGVQTSVHYPPTHLFRRYRSAAPGRSLPVTEDLAERLLSLPLHPRLTVGDVDRVCTALQAALVGTAP